MTPRRHRREDGEAGMIMVAGEKDEEVEEGGKGEEVEEGKHMKKNKQKNETKEEEKKKARAMRRGDPSK